MVIKIYQEKKILLFAIDNLSYVIGAAVIISSRHLLKMSTLRFYDEND